MCVCQMLYTHHYVNTFNNSEGAKIFVFISMLQFMRQGHRNVSQVVLSPKVHNN